MLLHPHRALVKAAAGDPFEVEFVNAIIATGAKPGRCRRGPVGLELAQNFAAFSVRVTLLDPGLRILEPVDEEIAQMLETRMVQQGVSLVLDARVSRICHAGGGAYVQYHDRRAQRTGPMENTSCRWPGTKHVPKDWDRITPKSATTATAYL